ncbi:heme-binding protein [Aquisphaera insulae]|uniref:heme-binding protein n=1 Tax=Aquisphaera insulae TaxID=2712864 RepID=UPI0013EBC5E2|nr:heme-binding protein [Aquisphaera insulae]
MILAKIRPDRVLSALLVLAALHGMGSSRPAGAQVREPEVQGGGPRRLSPPEMTTVPSDIRDGAGMFSEDAEKQARAELGRIEKQTGSPVLIQTIDSLDGEKIDQVAARLARRAGTQGIFVLVARKDMKLEVLPSTRYAEALNRPARDKVRATFIESFRKRRFDEGLGRGIEALEAELTAAKKLGKVPPGEMPEPSGESTRPGSFPPTETAMPAAVPSSGRADPHRAEASTGAPQAASSLVIRNQTRLTLEGARLIIAAAKGKAIEMNLKVNVAVVDDGGHLLSFDRMDGARTVSAYTSITKATSAATLRTATGPIPSGTKEPDPLLNLGLQLSAQASGGTLSTLPGGVPLVIDGQVIGAVGVGGNSGDQDAEIARVAVQAFVDAVQKPQPAPATPSESKKP